MRFLILNNDHLDEIDKYLLSLIFLVAFFNSHSYTPYSSSHVYLDVIQCVTCIPIQFITFWSQLQYQIYHNSQSHPNCYNLGFEDKLDDVLIHEKHYQCLENSGTQLKLKFGPYLSLQVAQTHLDLYDLVNIEKISSYHSVDIT